MPKRRKSNIEKLIEAQTKKEERKLKQAIKKELEQEVKDAKARKRAYGQKIYDNAEDVRTPEQIELSNKTYKEVLDFLEGKVIYSKFGNPMYPILTWRKFKMNKDEHVPRESIKVVEREIIKEVVKPNRTYAHYMDDRDPVPEEVIMTGFKDILDSYGINFLDDYTCRKLFYHIIMSIGHYLDVNPAFYLNLSDIHIYREPLSRNIFTVVIPRSSAKDKGTTVDSLFNYFVGGEMDLEALNKTLDVYALSYIEYTETKKSLTEKARDSYNRYRLLQEITAEAKEMLRKQGLNGKGYKQAFLELKAKLKEERRLQNRQRIAKYREEDAKKELTKNEVCDIIQEQEEDTKD